MGVYPFKFALTLEVCHKGSFWSLKYYEFTRKLLIEPVFAWTVKQAAND